MFRLVAFNIVLAVVLTTTLVCLIARAPSSPPKGPAPADSTIDAAVRQSLPLALVTTLITMVIAGGAGGTLCNLRGIFRWVSETGSFPARYATPFYVRPFTGAMTGLFAFFVGHLFVTSLSEGPANSWLYLEGRLPYIGLAIVAGFAAQEFMERLKEVARTLFNPSAPRPPNSKANGEQQ